MNLSINPIIFYNRVNYTKNNVYHKKEVNNNLSFQAVNTVKTAKKVFYPVVFGLLASVYSCTNTGKSNNTDELEETNTPTEQIDSSHSSTDKLSITEDNKKNKVEKYYHYSPSEKEISSTNYSWVETVYPDGKIEKDSMGYMITISPEGDRTEVKTELDSVGIKTITTILADSDKIVRSEYPPTKEGEILFVENYFRKDGKIKEVHYYKEYPSDSTDINSQKTVEQEDAYYNEDEVITKWKTSVIDSARNESNNIYDRRNRLIYDDVKNETFQYKGKSNTPYRSVSEYHDCKRITMYNKDGSIKEIYFKASDGTITPN